jgi:hypothetical protein
MATHTETSVGPKKKTKPANKKKAKYQKNNLPKQWQVDKIFEDSKE